MILYHADRNSLLSEGMKLDLKADYELTRPEQIVFRDLFPEGLSKHGINYIQDCVYNFRHFPVRFIPTSKSELRCIVADEITEANYRISSTECEYKFELIRRALFPTLPSRFQSIFAVSDLSDFEQWLDVGFTSDDHVYELQVPDGTKRFDSTWLRGGYNTGYDVEKNLVFQGYSPSISLHLAINYWKGAPSESPRWEYLVPLPVTVGRRIR